MKKRFHFLTLATLLIIVAAGLTSCIKTYEIKVSSQDLWFDLEAGSKTIDIEANCEWTIDKNDDAEWYTINAMSGENDCTITITVEALEDGDYRGSSFRINSPNGHVHRTVFVSQNKLEFYSMVCKIFGVSTVEHWNTDYYGQIIEDSYRKYDFNPYDTTTGYLMYFFENGKGVQRDHHNDTAVYYAFTYSYNPVDQILHIEFETVADAPENYDPQVLTASDSLYRFIHEYKPNFWERADMRKVGTFNSDGKSLLRQAIKKRKNDAPIFQF